MPLLQQPILLLSLFVAGISGQYLSVHPKVLSRRINKFVLYVPLPAIVLTKIPFLEINHDVLFPIASAWVVFFGAILFAYVFCRWMRYDRKTMACIILCCGLGNTSFVGYPILTYFYGEASIRYAIFVDQPGSFLILSTFGILIATYYSAADFGWKAIIEKLLKFPPFIVFLFALFIPKLFITGKTYTLLSILGKFMIPFAMLSLGLQFKLSLTDIPWKKMSGGLIYKLAIAPAIIYGLFFLFFGQRSELSAVSVLECAMPPMITSSILAADHDLDAELANVFPTLGILFSIPTLFYWKWLAVF